MRTIHRIRLLLDVDHAGDPWHIEYKYEPTTQDDPIVELTGRLWTLLHESRTEREYQPGIDLLT